MDALTYLNIGNNQINHIPAGTFAPLRNLRDLDIFANTFTELTTDMFAGLSNLAYLQMGYAPIQTIQTGAFRGLNNLKQLIISQAQLNQIQPTAFEDLRSLNYLDLEQNGITDLGTFLLPLTNLRDVSFRNNGLRTIRRSNFGSVATLDTLNLDGNLVSAFDKALLDAAVNFNSLYFNGNVCASRFFASFTYSRAEYYPALQTCFNNFDNLSA